jgi:hypothetical protein
MSKGKQPTQYARRDVQKAKPDILGRYHDLVVANDLAGYEKLLDQYPQIAAEERAELIADFKLVAETVLRRRWLRPKSQ